MGLLSPSQRSTSRQVRTAGWCLLVAVWAFAALLRPEVQAQDAAAPPAAAPAAAAAAAPAAAAEPAAAEGHSEGAQSQSSLMWLIHTSGWIGLVLLILSIYFLSKVFQLFVELRPSVVAPESLMQELQSLLQARDYNGIYRVAKDNGSALGNMVAAGMLEMQSGIDPAREAVERVGEVTTVEMEKNISMLAVLGSLGPMIGLLGTLKGMIASFSVIAMSDTQLKPSEVAGGISEALVLTFEGVGLSVPAIYFFALFKNRVSSLTINTQFQADEFIRQVYAAARNKAAPTPAAT